MSSVEKKKTKKLFKSHNTNDGTIFNSEYSVESLIGDTSSEESTETKTEESIQSNTHSTSEESSTSVTSTPATQTPSQPVIVQAPVIPTQTPAQPLKMQAPNLGSFGNAVAKQNNSTNKASSTAISTPQTRQTPEDIRDIPYIRARLMSRAEIKFYHFLKSNLTLIDKVEILTKVNLWDLVDIDRTKLDNDQPRQRIKGFHADYVIVDKEEMTVICVIELDDFTHNDPLHQRNDIIKDTVLDTAGIKKFRIGVLVDSITKATIADIDKLINDVFAPTCPYCHIKMSQRQNNATGHRFYGCDNFFNNNINCKFSIDID